MANAEFDVKAITDKMEQNGNGCALLFDEAFQLLNKDYAGQMKLIDRVEQEAKSRSDNRLNFEHIHETAVDPRTKILLEYEGVNIRVPDGTAIFQEIKTSLAENHKPLAVQRTCKPGK